MDKLRRNLRVFASFNNKLWKQEFTESSAVRDACLTELIFYLSEDEIKKLSKLINDISQTDLEKDRAKRTEAKAKITQLLRDSLDKNDTIVKEKDIAPIFVYQPFKLMHDMYTIFKKIIFTFIALFISRPKESKIAREITSLHDNLTPTNNPNSSLNIIQHRINEEEDTVEPPSDITGDNKQNNIVAEDKQSKDNEDEKQAWHFNAWDGRQFEQFNNIEKKEECELSLIEYEEDWRTNLVKQVKEGDRIMLFRRGGYGYVGAFKALGWRVFCFEDGKEEIQYFGEELKIITEKDNKDRFLKDVEKYDIYNSKEDGATLCSNLIVKPIAYVPEGVGNPGGVYRRTISRYDSHYAQLLEERFKKNGQWKE